MIKIGLTGGIACGKTLVREELERLGVPTLDSDQLAREVVRPGEPAHRKIVKAFGDSFLQSDGSIDRQKLGDLVFADEESRQRLNRIVHPEILKRQKAWFESVAENSQDRNRTLAVIDAALLIETGNYRNYDVLIVVHCRPEQQLDRLMRRDGTSRPEAEKRIRSQMPIEEKLRHADFAVDNSGSRDETRRQVEQILRRIRVDSRNREGSPPGSRFG